MELNTQAIKDHVATLFTGATQEELNDATELYINREPLDSIMAICKERKEVREYEKCYKMYKAALRSNDVDMADGGPVNYDHWSKAVGHIKKIDAAVTLPEPEVTTPVLTLPDVAAAAEVVADKQILEKDKPARIKDIVDEAKARN